ncbi:MAG: cytochrome c [Sulfurimonas sp.]|nr:cytochrome c [Sulfurimonas sp.]
MLSRVFFVLTCTLFFSSSLFALQNVAGQKYYLKYCSKCHGAGNRGGGLAKSYEWEEYFKNSGKMILFFHEEEPKALEYLKTDKFQRQSRKIMNFLIEFSSDSANIPSCNN